MHLVFQPEEGGANPTLGLQYFMNQISLTQGFVTFVDDEDFERFGYFKWYARVYKNGTVYAARRIKGKWISLHKAITGTGPRELIDHRDGNSLNNQRANLRRATVAQNMFNSKPRLGRTYKGVYLVKGHRYKFRCWRAQIRQAGLSVHVGYFATEVEAAKAYDEAIKKIRGDFARLNFAHSEERGSIPTAALQTP